MKPFHLSMTSLVVSVLVFITVVTLHFTIESNSVVALSMIGFMFLQTIMIVLATKGEKTELGSRIFIITLMVMAAIFATLLTNLYM